MNPVLEAPRLAQPEASLGYLLGRVAILEVAVRACVARRGAGDPNPGDPLRGVYLSDSYVEWLLDRPMPTQDDDDAARSLEAMRVRLERDADVAQQRGVDIRFRRLTQTFGLGPLEEDLLVVALAPMLDRRFGQFYGYLNDDVTHPYASVALAVELASGRFPGNPRDSLLVAPGSPLVAAGLIDVPDSDAPLPARSIRVADRVVAFLLGDDAPDSALAEYLADVDPLPIIDPTLAAIPNPHRVMLRQYPGTDAAVESATWLAAIGPAPLVATLPHQTMANQSDVVALLVRECRLTGRPLVLGPLHPDRTATGPNALWRAVRDVPVVVLWSRDENDSPAGEVTALDLTVPAVDHRAKIWRELCRDLPVTDADLLLLAAHHRMGAAHIRGAVRTGHAWASAAGSEPNRLALERGVRLQDGAAMRGLADRVSPRRTWSDLTLTGATTRKLRELIGMIRHRDELADEWGLARGGAARGVTALFVGHSGTGKTLAAEVLAHELGVELYRIDLSRIVDKYVGETEKNLDRVLSAAEAVTGVVFFDEADALLGRRGSVERGQDRYANLEVSFLLQRIETLNAVVVLATNLRSQVDEAFVRRLDSVIEFGPPDAEAREQIWRQHLARLPVAEGTDVDFCARTFELSGGSIRNVAAAAGCLAADAGRPVTMEDLVRALEREYEKLGRLRVPGDFGRYGDFLGKDGFT